MDGESRGGMSMGTRFEGPERDVCLLQSRRDACRIAVRGLHALELRVRHDVVQAGTVERGRDVVLAVVGTLFDANIRTGVRKPENKKMLLIPNHYLNQKSKDITNREIMYIFCCCK